MASRGAAALLARPTLRVAYTAQAWEIRRSARRMSAGPAMSDKAKFYAHKVMPRWKRDTSQQRIRPVKNRDEPHK
jgi:hypothetical protein